MEGAPAVPPQTEARQHRDFLRAATAGHAGRLQWLRQVHGNRCIRATFDSCATAPEADAAWTDETGLGLVVQTADCVPIAVADQTGDRIGIAHGGWRGLVGGVIESLVEALGNTLTPSWPGSGRPLVRTPTKSGRRCIRGALGFWCRIGQRGIHCGCARPGKWQLDLYALSARLLAAVGVTRVHGERLCTYSDPRFYSYRARWRYRPDGDGDLENIRNVMIGNDFQAGSFPVELRGDRDVRQHGLLG